MDLRKCISFDGPLCSTMAPSVFPDKVPSSIEYEKQQTSADRVGGDIDIDIREIYFLIMHFLSAGPCQTTFEQLQKELFQHQLLPRRYHAWFSRSAVHSGTENDDGISFPLNYNNLVERYSHIEKDHLVRLMKQLMLTIGPPLNGKLGAPGAADVPTFLGTGSFSLLDSERSAAKKPVKVLPAYLRWPHMQADQVRGLSLREIGGGFRKHQRAASIHSACYAIAKPSMMVQRMQNVKKIRGHRVAVYCAIFDRSGRHVITGSDDRLVKIWSMETAFCLASYRGHEGDITDLAVSSNNALVASSSNDFVIRVWRLLDGMPISVLRGHTGAVTAIAFNPRPSSVYQLLSSSDDGTCRIWDARLSQCTPKIYLPRPLDTVAGKSNVSISDPSLSVGQQSHQILCCAYNANGTVFVTGSSDTLARVWNASKVNVDNPEEPVHEMDVLSGHENDVNYVQFSGCSVSPRSSISDTLKEDNIPKFKNSWFCHDNIVTCSRDGSAIIWVPILRRSHGKGGRWVRAYHLKVPPPPLPPQPPRGGPRQRILPTPRGVNMIIWSLDNRFVLAAIMDCRICVWNAADGSLVHSLTGHNESSYVLDVHPFNPRIAMSAGYDGKAIVWDIWEGTPIRVYEIGRVKLVDGKFSPDGTSIVLSDDFGQLHLLNTGEGESQKGAKYDQFFLGDYRPLIRDTTGNVLDQESQLPPHRRNVQDPLCDSSMIPYPEPYQTMYQRQRLGALGVEWRPPSMRFAIGLDFSLGQDFQVPPLADVERLMEPLPEFIDAMYWEPENEVLTDDNDSEFNVAEECSSEGERCSLSGGFSSDQCSDGPRRSGRSKQCNEFGVATSSGRRIRKRNLDECEGSNSRVVRNSKKPKGRKKGSTRQNSRANTLRPQRVAARNASAMFSQYSGTSTEGEAEAEAEAEEFSEHSSPERDVVLDSDIESNGTESKNLHPEYGNEKQIARPSEPSGPQPNAGNRKRLVLKFTLRDPKKPSFSEDIKLDTVVANPSSRLSQDTGENRTSCSVADGELRMPPNENSNKFEELSQNADQGKNENDIRLGDVQSRSLMHLKLDVASFSSPKEDDINARRDKEESAAETITRVENDVRVEDSRNSSLKDPTSLIEQGDPAPLQKDPPQKPTIFRFKTSRPKLGNSVEGSTGAEDNISTIPLCVEQGQKSIVTREVTDRVNSREPIQCKSKAAISVNTSSGKHPDIDSDCDNDGAGGDDEDDEDDDDDDYDGNDDGNSREPIQCKSKAAISVNTSSGKHPDIDSDCDDDGGGGGDDEDDDDYDGNDDDYDDIDADYPETPTDAIHRKRSMKMKATSREPERVSSRVKFRRGHDPPATSKCVVSSRKASDRTLSDDWILSSKMTRSKIDRTRNSRNEMYGNGGNTLVRNSSLCSIKQSWLMLSAPDMGYRYIPQLGDEVAYITQGHQEFFEGTCSSELGQLFKGINLRAVEICKVESLKYATSAGSGESCCKLTLRFIDHTSRAFGKTYKLTLPELIDFPDFLVEKTWYDNSIRRNWTLRDKCSVWWRSGTDGGGDWWPGRIVSVRAKSAEFPDSPWERYCVHYDSESSEKHQHSPWELHDSDTPCEQPQIDPMIKKKLWNLLEKLERSDIKNQDPYGYRKLNEVAQKKDFSNRFPVAIYPNLIEQRLNTDYYRNMEAVKHDIEVMLSIARSYFTSNGDLSAKMRRLSDWFERKIVSIS